MERGSPNHNKIENFPWGEWKPYLYGIFYQVDMGGLPLIKNMSQIHEFEEFDIRVIFDGEISFEISLSLYNLYESYL